jgi:hypothetical protein
VFCYSLDACKARCDIEAPLPELQQACGTGCANVCGGQ